MNVSESDISPRKQLQSMLKMISDKTQQEELKKNMKWTMFTNCSWSDCKKEDYSIVISAFKDLNWEWVLQIIIKLVGKLK